MVKSILFGLSFFSISFASERSVELLSPIKEKDYYSESKDTVELYHFIDLKDRSGRLCKGIPKTISHEFTPKIPKICSEGQVEKEETKLDCESINMLVRIECHQAAGILLSISASHSILAKNVAQESYDKARERYQNALYHIIAAFSLDCYKTMEKLHQVLTAFTQAEIEAKQMNPSRKLDPEIQKIHPLLEKIIHHSENEKKSHAPPSIPHENTKELVRALATQANKSLENGHAYLTAGKTLLNNLKDPPLESLNSIEITFFLSLEHFIAAYYRDINQGLDEAEFALAELEKVHILKINKFAKEGQRYYLAKKKLEEAKNSNIKPVNEDHSTTTSDYSLEKFLHEDATQDRLAPSSDEASQIAEVDKQKAPTSLSLDSARSVKRILNESERAVKEGLQASQNAAPPATVQSRTTPLSVIKSAWKQCKKAGKGTANGIKYLWKKLPF